ncbi:MAG TPA: metallophosphoesterase [Solirubrobacterales bacterium]|nr:metallophosphoesterase [Solirubrobacterales bacterium]
MASVNGDGRLPAAGGPRGGKRLRIAATGDIHCRDSNRDAIVESFAGLDDDVDLVLIAGDLTSHGRLDEAEILCEAAARTEAPVYAVLGNHDWHAGEAEAILARLSDGGVRMLDRSASVCQAGGVEVGIVGVKGFVGGFAPRHLPDFGEPSLRAVYQEATDEVQALEQGLHEVATCPVRIVLLHYAPIEATLEGEPREIWVFLGSDRLAAPILEHGPDLVLHGHAHAGSADGMIGETPVHNVSQPVLGTDFRIFELDASRTHSPIP